MNDHVSWNGQECGKYVWVTDANDPLVLALGQSPMDFVPSFYDGGTAGCGATCLDANGNLHTNECSDFGRLLGVTMDKNTMPWLVPLIIGVLALFIYWLIKRKK